MAFAKIGYSGTTCFMIFSLFMNLKTICFAVGNLKWQYLLKLSLVLLQSPAQPPMKEQTEQIDHVLHSEVTNGSMIKLTHEKMESISYTPVMCPMGSSSSQQSVTRFC